MGVDYYPCGADGCENVVCDAGDYKRCDLCSGFFHVKCWAEVGMNLCRLCPCACGGASREEAYPSQAPGKASDYTRDPVEQKMYGCEGCDCQSHHCDTLPCCSSCFRKITEEPNVDEVKKVLVEGVSPEDLAKALGKDVEAARARVRQRNQRTVKFVPYPTRTCDECQAHLDFSAVAGECGECHRYLCTGCWPLGTEQCLQCPPVKRARVSMEPPASQGSLLPCVSDTAAE